MVRAQMARLQDIEEVVDGRSPFRPVRLHFGITTFGVSTWTAVAAGDQLINEHDESGELGGDELYFVVSGRARFEISGEPTEAEAGTFVAVPADISRTAFALEAGTTVLAMGGGREGQAYEPGGWELVSPLLPLFEAGRYADVVKRAQPMIDREPGSGVVLYCLACAESLLGRADDALAHLRTAVDRTPTLGPLAREDEDFEPISGEPAFDEITGG